jgi:hypothetical protein
MEKQKESVATRLYVASCWLIQQGFPVNTLELLQGVMGGLPLCLGEGPLDTRYFLFARPSTGKLFCESLVGNWTYPSEDEVPVSGHPKTRPWERVELLEQALSEVSLLEYKMKDEEGYEPLIIQPQHEKRLNWLANRQFQESV